MGNDERVLYNNIINQIDKLEKILKPLNEMKDLLDEYHDYECSRINFERTKIDFCKYISNTKYFSKDGFREI